MKKEKCPLESACAAAIIEELRGKKGFEKKNCEGVWEECKYFKIYFEIEESHKQGTA